MKRFRGRSGGGPAPGAVAAGVLLIVGLVAGEDVLRPNAEAASGIEASRSAGASTLTVPDGFEVERVAGPPLVNRPIVADFDEQGRLYVADSSGSNDKVERQLAERPHRMVRLEDRDGDGRFDSSTVFADRMMLPEGTMWLDGSLYVAAPPSIWKLTDTDGDGVADRREEWFQGKTLTGCANDLHGPYLGPDGWIYWTKGAFAEQTYERPGKAPLVTRASHVLRRRPGDSEIDIVMTGGMDNPVDVAFTASGERILTATFLKHPQAGERDAIVHAVYGGVYGKPHGVLDGHRQTGELLPVMAQLGPAVPSGLTRYASRAFGDEYRDSFFATMFNLRKVSRVVLEPRGATFEAHLTDFLVSTDRDFHPTDVVEDADGSLLVLDTGPWYKLCCPTSQLALPEVTGAIYRVRRKGAPRPPDARGQELAWDSMTPDELVRRLDDERPAVVERTKRELGKLGQRAVPALRGRLGPTASPDARRHAVWALARIEGGAAREAVRAALDDPHPTVRHAAAHAAGLWRDADAAPRLRRILRSDTPPLQRAAAEALGRSGDAAAVPDLLAVAGPGPDRMLEHSLTYALIEIGQRGPVEAAAGALPAAGTRAALVALDQMEGGGLEADDVLPLLDAPEPVLKDTAWWIARNHPEWGGDLAGYFERRLAGAPAPSELARLEPLLAHFGHDPAVQALLADRAVPGRARDVRRMALRAIGAIARAGAKEIPQRLAPALAAALGSEDVEAARLAVAAARAIGRPPGDAALRTALLDAARSAGHPLALRLEALAAAQEPSAPLERAHFDLALGGLAPGAPMSARGLAAAVLERATLDRPQLLALARALETAGPMELPRLLRVFHQGRDEEIGALLVGSLAASPGRPALRTEELRAVLAGYPASVHAAAQTLLSSIETEAGRRAAHLEGLLASAANGDPRRGQAVFNSEKAACASCHTIGYLGGRTGPDLTRVGEVRSERDLLEAVVFPSASFARGYEPVVVRLTTGETHSGALRSDLPHEIVVATVEHDEVRIPRERIAEMQGGQVSLMPPGYDEHLTRQELADLLAFLRAAKRP